MDKKLISIFVIRAFFWRMLQRVFMGTSRGSSRLHKPFHYFPVDIKNSYTGKNIRGFKFPATGNNFDDTSAVDMKTYNNFQLYFGVNEVIRSLQDLIRNEYAPVSISSDAQTRERERNIAMHGTGKFG